MYTGLRGVFQDISVQPDLLIHLPSRLTMLMSLVIYTIHPHGKHRQQKVVMMMISDTGTGPHCFPKAGYSAASGVQP
jgi:hypothetical protein